MSVDRFTKLLEKIKHHPIETAKLMGMGEPFLHPQFDVICKTFKKYFPNAFLISATNCQYSLEKASWFSESLKYIDMLYLSIDGYGENYERDRYPSKWEKLLKFLEELKTTNKHDCKITCNYVVNPNNINDIQKIYDEIIVPYNIEQLRLNIAQDWSEDKTLSGGYTAEQLEYLRTTWQENIQGKSEWDYTDCFWVKEGLYTTVEGRVLACCMNTSANSFGNIFHESIETIHQSAAYQKVKIGCSNNTPTSHCKNCSYKELSPLLKTLGVSHA
jgi:sulfatase maturation enzyme AslB (radical SAM superfamily)